MQILSLTHQCLLFKYNKQKYLFGLSSTLAQDFSTLKRTKTDYIIFPSWPYNIEHSLSLWHLDALKNLNCKNIIVPDLIVRKRIELLMSLVLPSNAYKWELMKQHQLIEQQLWKIYDQYKGKIKVEPLFYEPNGLGYNDRFDKLNIIVPQFGRSILLLHESDAIIIDPSQCVESTLGYYGIPFQSLKAVILTRSYNLNLFELLFKSSIHIITTQPIYLEVKKQLKSYFHWDEEMLKKKMKGKILTQEKKFSKYCNLDILYKDNKFNSMQYLDILFGLRRVRIYPNSLEYYPSELLQLKDLDLLILYEIGQFIKKELEHSPEVYRKRILYNRISRKYGNKYFYTINAPSQYISIQAHQYRKQQLKQLTDLSFLYKEKDRNYCLQYKQLNHDQIFNANERVVYVRKGYIKDQKGNYFKTNARINGARQIIGFGNAIIMFEPIQLMYFNQGSKLIDPQKFLKGEDLLKKIKQNSFIKSLKKCRETIYSSNEFQNQDNELVELGSQWEIFNSACTLKTFQAGSEMGRNLILYFIVKGCMKYRNAQNVAIKSMGIGNLRQFYNTAYDDNDEIEVVKDTWAIQINLKQLHGKFLSVFPSRMYELFIKANIFQ